VTNNDERAIIRRERPREGKESERVTKGGLTEKKFPKIPSRGRCIFAVTHFAVSLIPPTSASSPRSSNSSVCLLQRAHESIRDTRSRCTRAPLLTEGLLEREIFEVANLFPRLILQRISRLGWHAVVHQNDQVLLCGRVFVLQLSLVTLSFAAGTFLFLFLRSGHDTDRRSLGKDNTL